MKITKFLSLFTSILAVGSGGFYIGSRNQVIEIPSPSTTQANIETTAQTQSTTTIVTKNSKPTNSTSKAVTTQTKTPIPSQTTTQTPAPEPVTKVS